MHLHDHFGLAFFIIQYFQHGVHAELDQIGCRALHGRIDGGALRSTAARAVGRIDLGQIQATAKHGFNKAFGFGAELGLVHVLLHAGVALKITVNVSRSRLGFNLQIARQTKTAHAVNQPEVDDLGIAALLTADLAHRHAKHLGSGSAVHVHAIGECLEQGFVTADVGHDAQLDLRVISAGNHTARRGDKSFTDTATFRCFHRNVLQIRVVARQTARDRHGLRVMRVNTAGFWVGQLGEFVGVGSLELGKPSVLQDFGGQRVVFCQLFQHLFVRGRRATWRFFDHWQAQFGEENLANLLGTAQIERLARQSMGIGLQLQDAHAQFTTLFGKDRPVNQHAVALDAVQAFAAVDFELIDKAQLVMGCQLRPQHLVHAQGLVGVFTGVSRRLVNVHLVELDLVRALAAQIFKRGAAALQVPVGKARQPVRLVDFQHVALQHGVVRITLHLNAVVGKHMAVVLDVLAELAPGRIFQPGFEPGQHQVTGKLRRRVRIVVPKRNVSRGTRRDANTDPDDFGLHFVE